jgi:hypothetical protein
MVAKAERGGDVIQLNQINPQRTVLNFGNGAARGVMPASELQPVGKKVLRPIKLVALSAHQPPDEISLLHFQPLKFSSYRKFVA